MHKILRLFVFVLLDLGCRQIAILNTHIEACTEIPCASNAINYLCMFIVFFSVALGECAKDKESLKNIHTLDGVRLVWSLLKHPSERVRILE